MSDTIGTLQVTPEEMLAAASQLSSYLRTMQDCFSNMRNTMRGTVGYWVGEAGDAHRQLYEEQVAKTEEIIRRYQEHVTDLNAMAGVYSDAEQTAKATVDQLPVSNL